MALHIRKARIKDVSNIHRLVNHYASMDKMLPRSLSEIYENLRDFFVCKEGNSFLGCAALHIDWSDLAEIKSLAVKSDAQKRGIGAKLVKVCLGEALELGITKVFALTYKPEFFLRQGFSRLDKSKLPHKIWSECVKCPKFPDCGETALVIDRARKRRSKQK